MAKKKKETAVEAVAEVATGRTLTMDNGDVYGITAEDGKYYVCGVTKFRKSNPHIVKVEG